MRPQRTRMRGPTSPAVRRGSGDNQTGDYGDTAASSLDAVALHSGAADPMKIWVNGQSATASSRITRARLTRGRPSFWAIGHNNLPIGQAACLGGLGQLHVSSLNLKFTGLILGTRAKPSHQPRPITPGFDDQLPQGRCLRQDGWPAWLLPPQPGQKRLGCYAASQQPAPCTTSCRVIPHLMSRLHALLATSSVLLSDRSGQRG